MLQAGVGAVRAQIYTLAVAAFLMLPGQALAFGVAVGGLPQQDEYLESDYAGSDAGYVVLSIGLHDADVGIRNIVMDAEKDDGRTLAAFALKTGIWASKNDFNKDGIETGVIVRALSPGNYALTRYFGTVGGNCGSGAGSASFSVPFSVKAGRVTYLGSFRYEPLVWNTIFGAACSAGGYFVVSDERERDLTTAKTKRNTLPEAVDAQIPDVKTIDLPLFQSAVLPHPQSSPTGLHSRDELREVYGLIKDDRKKAREEIAELMQSGDMSQNDLSYLHSWLGMLDIMENDNTTAETELSEAIRLNPNLADAWGDRAVMKYERGDFEGAFTDVKKALHIAPSNRTWLLALGDIEIERNHPDLAMIAFDDAIAIAPGSAPSYMRRAYANIKLDRPDLALADIERGMKATDANEPLLLAARCALNVRMGHSSALADCDSALKLAPKDITVLYTCGIAHLTAGDNAGAIENFNATLAIRTDQTMALFGRGLAKQRMGDAQGGKADIDAAYRFGHYVDRFALYRGVAPNDARANSTGTPTP